jgi:hypothetical protein
MVVLEVAAQDTTQVLLIQHDELTQAFSPNGPGVDESTRWTSQRRATARAERGSCAGVRQCD